MKNLFYLCTEIKNASIDELVKSSPFQGEEYGFEPRC